MLIGEDEGGVRHGDVGRTLRLGNRVEVRVDGRHVGARRGPGERP